MTDQSRAVWERLEGSRSIALLDPQSPQDCLRAYELLDPLGIVLEIAFRSDHALPGIEAVRRAHPSALLLAGTVLTRDQAESALAAGVAGVVSPDYVPEVVELCVGADVMCVPGGLADCGKQLARKAELYRCTLEELRRGRPWQWVYKIFPISGNEAFVRRAVAAWRGVYPRIRFIYTGGLTPENLGSVSRQDPEGFFCGSSLTRHLDDASQVRNDAESWLRVVREIRDPGAAAAADTATAAPAPPPGERGGAEPKGRGVVTFGEVLLRLSPPSGTRLRNGNRFDVTYGGAEANVAAALAQWGISSRYVTVLPEHDLAEAALDRLRGLGVDTSHVFRREGRMGIYFLEHGAGPRAPRVLYDRAGSAVAGVDAGEVDWKTVFSGAAWFHHTGITPALSEGSERTVREAVQVARAMGLTVSFDLNYRSKLWSLERARTVLTPLVEEADVLMGNGDQLTRLFGFPHGGSADQDGSSNEERFGSLARHLVERFGLRMAAVTLKGGSASRATSQAFLHDGTEGYRTPLREVDVVDGVGAGDAFAAGLIYGTLAGLSPQDALEFGAGASCLKLTMAGDWLLATADEVREMTVEEPSRGIQR
ncbi:MAG: KHG/KDPG aldolase/sugar kinase fusion protein [Gemmatimonadota bacterium]